MKQFEYSDITCALTHSIETCMNCKKCGKDGVETRIYMAEYVKQLHKALDKACEELEQFEYTLSNYHYNEHKSKEQWKEYLLEESEK